MATLPILGIEYWMIFAFGRVDQQDGTDRSHPFESKHARTAPNDAGRCGLYKTISSPRGFEFVEAARLSGGHLSLPYMNEAKPLPKRSAFFTAIGLPLCLMSRFGYTAVSISGSQMG
jgi:hypothetical protein